MRGGGGVSPFPKTRRFIEVKQMEKEFYKSFFMEIIEWDKQDVVTLSESFSDGDDDFGKWNEGWFGE